MTDFDEFSDGFDEDDLPEGQPIIRTSNVEKFEKFMKLLQKLRERRRKPTMGAITGAAGVGKSITVADFVRHYPSRPHTGLPGCIKVRVRARSTPKALAVDIASALGEQPRGVNVYQVADEAAMAMQRNDVEIMLLDEGDRLNDDSFEVVRHIFAKTGIPIVLVGLPELYRIIRPKTQFRNRVGLHLKFEVLSAKEVIEVVLPQIILPSWQFDPENPEDRALGERLWARTQPALRVLQDVLQIASLYAELQGVPKITQGIIDEAFKWCDEQSLQKQRKRKPSKGKKTDYERQSEERQRGHRKDKDEENGQDSE